MADGNVLVGVLGDGSNDATYYFSTTENCTVEFVENNQGSYSTDAKIVVKNNAGDIIETYIVSVTGDLNGDGAVDPSDSSAIEIVASGMADIDFVNRTVIY